MATYTVNSLVWIPDEQHIYLPAKVVGASIKAGEKGQAQVLWHANERDAGPSDDGSRITVELTPAQTLTLLHMDDQSLNPIDDMVTLSDLSEASILHNLRLRFRTNDIYTYVSSKASPILFIYPHMLTLVYLLQLDILISINPFKLLSLYTPNVLEKYIESKVDELPPHIFSIAANAFNALQDTDNNQSVVISGESGSGKTESMKLILMYLAEISSRRMNHVGTGSTTNLEQQILRSNPIMEAFGNAKTIRLVETIKMSNYIY